MDIVTVLCAICIVVEIINILFLKTTSKLSLEVNSWINTFRMYNHIISVSKMYQQHYSDHNTNLKNILSEREIVSQKNRMRDFIYSDCSDSSIPSKILINMVKTIGQIRFSFYLFHQTINIVYWIITLALAFMLPFPAGAILFVLITGLAIVQYKTNYKIPHLTRIDSFVCICMFLFVMYVY